MLLMTNGSTTSEYDPARRMAGKERVMDLTIDCDRLYVINGVTERQHRVELSDIDTSDLDITDVYDVIDVDAFCAHRKLELKEA